MGFSTMTEDERAEVQRVHSMLGTSADRFSPYCAWCDSPATHVNFWHGRYAAHETQVCEWCTRDIVDPDNVYDYVLPIVFVDVGSELHIALECAFATLAQEGE